MLRGFCELEILSRQAYSPLRAFGILNKTGEARRLMNDYRLLRQTHTQVAAQLALMPAARMTIKADGTAQRSMWSRR
jgi:hypothetical protein